MSYPDGYKVAIVGGCGHVGLPLGIKFALAGAVTRLIDIDPRAVAKVNGGAYPYLEEGGAEQLQQALQKGLLATLEADEVKGADVVVFVIGTPVDEHLNPKVSDVTAIIDAYLPRLEAGTCVIMRSTLFPGTMEHLLHRFQRAHSSVRLAFCPERVAQGVALREIVSLPQIVSAFDEESFQAAYQAFRELAPEVVRLTPLEAEMTKLMANSWRYLEFSIANQFYMIAEEHGVDFYKIYQAIRYEYPRADGYKSPGFAAGPCLFKDTMQLSSFSDHKFHLGHSSMLVNEGLAPFVVGRCAERVGGELWGKTVGLLGMTFKANNDDIRESLSFRVRKALEFRGAATCFHDPYLEGSLPLEEMQSRCDAFILCTPHREFRDFRTDKPVIDVWGFFGMPELDILPGTGVGA